MLWAISFEIKEYAGKSFGRDKGILIRSFDARNFQRQITGLRRVYFTSLQQQICERFSSNRVSTPYWMCGTTQRKLCSNFFELCTWALNLKVLSCRITSLWWYVASNSSEKEFFSCVCDWLAMARSALIGSLCPRMTVLVVFYMETFAYRRTQGWTEEQNGLDSKRKKIESLP